jgi:hypothetical protein
MKIVNVPVETDVLNQKETVKFPDEAVIPLAEATSR